MKEIEIPEGYEARIDGNKVIIELKENEDERIRKEIIRIVDIWTDSSPVVNGIPRETLLAYLEKQKEQKPTNSEKSKEWSKEDEKMLLSAIEYIQTYPAHRQSVVNWLKSLRPQSKQEWSEENEKMLNRCIIALEGPRESNSGWPMYISEINWLKSLRPQPHWKPSEEQIHAIVEALKYIPNNKEEWIILENLMNDLQKLL